jgi:hypothetical protein
MRFLRVPSARAGKPTVAADTGPLRGPWGPLQVPGGSADGLQVSAGWSQC